jgi:peptidoglycan/xylan/chitin deacetylase (PgdA/CDA1 family)
LTVEIAVAVIARPGSSTVEACFGALRAGGAAPRVYEVGADGAGMARNRALAECGADVIALVEDDVVVDVRWPDALRGAWGRADDDVALVGGPLRLRFPSGRPEWLGRGTDAAFAVMDLGSEAIDVDPATRTFHAGNISFRASALRGVAGFWPARGHPDARDWFSEEHHAQHALAAQGWRGRYEPAVAAERVVMQPRVTTILRRRWRYGARLAAAGGGRARGVATRTLVTSTAGAVVAGDRMTRLERMARAAENLGVLVGGPLARRDLEPVASATPFRPSVPAVSGRRRRRTQRGALVLLYHRVAAPRQDPLGLCVSPRHFDEQLEILASARRVVSLEDLVAQPERDMVALTFDDGYRDNALAGAPLLAARGLPWTLFVSTGHVDERVRYWWDDVIALLAIPGRAPELELELPGGPRAWRVDTAARLERARDFLLAALQGVDAATVRTALNALSAWAHERRGDRDGVPMSIGELCDIARAGAAIGAHTRTHRGLAYASETDQREEVLRSRDDIAGWLGKSPTMFAYPFGVPGADVDARAQAIVRSAGFRLAVLNSPGVVTPRTDSFAIPRCAVPDIGAGAFGAWLRDLAR